MPENKIPGLFTVYYMNQQKVFETRMLLDNKLKTTSSKENQNGTTKRASLNAEAELNPPFLTKLRAKLEGSVRHELNAMGLKKHRIGSPLTLIRLP